MYITKDAKNRDMISSAWCMHKLTYNMDSINYVGAYTMILMLASIEIDTILSSERPAWDTRSGGIFCSRQKIA